MLSSIKRFQGKIAVVTGASSGIGEAISKKLVQNGIVVAGLARRVEKIDALAKQINTEQAEKSGKLHAFKCDMTNEEEIISTIKDVIQNLGPINILVNNAGVVSLPSSLINGSTKSWKTTLDTNVLGLSIATREVVQNMIENKTAGHVIHINSTAGHRVANFPGIEMYTPSKYAVTALAQILKNELNNQDIPIKVTSLSPGYVHTNIFDASGISKDLVPKFIPLDGTDIAEAALYILSTPPHVNISQLTIQPIGEFY